MEGAPIQASESVPSTSAATNCCANSSQPGTKQSTFSVKIVKANMILLANGKVEFEQLEQVHISVDDHSANVHTVNSAIHAKWGAEFVVVTGDGLEVDDSAGTQGIYLLGMVKHNMLFVHFYLGYRKPPSC